MFVVGVVVVVEVSRFLEAWVSVAVGGMIRLVGVVVKGVRRRFLCCKVCCGVWCRLLPNWPACCGIARVARGLGVALHRKPVARCVGQWCQGVGGWHGQHHVMEERKAPQK